MKKYIILMSAIVLIGSACKKSPAPQKSSDAPDMTQTEEVPFVIPAFAKKQEKYFSEGTPSRAIQDLDDMLDSYILNPKTPKDHQYNANLKKAVLHGTFDIRELCRLALDQHWGERSSREQDDFVSLMIHLLEKKAIFSKEQGQKNTRSSKNLYQVIYEGDKFLGPDKKSALAMSAVHVPSENLKIGLNYKLKKEGEEWKIYDVIVDGASLLDNYKYQFDRIIDKEGYPTLVHRMESKLKELEEKAKKDSRE